MQLYVTLRNSTCAHLLVWRNLIDVSDADVHTPPCNVPRHVGLVGPHRGVAQLRRRRQDLPGRVHHSLPSSENPPGRVWGQGE